MAAQAIPTAAPPSLRRVALVGNPNTGKSTVFNALAGMNARTGNYPGVTIEKKLGRFRSGDQVVELVDLPGTYSLAPRSPDELVAVDVLTGDTSVSEPVDAILCVLNATLLQRNLFLLSQVLELGKPVVVAVNMIDAAEARGQQIDLERFTQALGVPVVFTSASRRQGIETLREALVAAVNRDEGPVPASPLPKEFYEARDALTRSLAALGSTAGSTSNRLPDDYVIERALLDQGGEAERRLIQRFGPSAAEEIREARQRLSDTCGLPADIECNARYAWARKKLDGVISESTVAGASWTDWLDALLTHRIFGLAIFIALMFAVFQSIYTLAQWPMEIFETAQGFVASAISDSLEPGMLRSLIVDGVIAGVGGVLIFLPQIALLFLFIAILEDCGYMSRAAFLVDRIMSLFGLSGKAFLPLMSSFACAVPGVMATRVIENRRDRLTTMMVAPLMSCSARLPVYLLLIGAFVPAHGYMGGFLTLQGLVLMAMYLLGIVVAIPVAFLLKKTMLRGEPAPFVLELPEYKRPSLPVLVERVYQSCKAFVIRAGTLIFSAAVLIWAAGFLPGDHSRQFALQAEIEQLEARAEATAAALESEIQQLRGHAEATAVDAQLEQQMEAAQWAYAPQIEQLDEQIAEARQAHNAESSRLLSGSFLGQTGHWIEPVVRPLGWDWRIGVGALASFPAREVIIATLGTVYSLGGDVGEEDAGLVDALRSARWPDGRPVYTLPVALSIMVFFALCAQCVSTLLVIRRETNSWRWPLFSFTYMTVLAYLGALVVYQIGSRLG